MLTHYSLTPCANVPIYPSLSLIYTCTCIGKFIPRQLLPHPANSSSYQHSNTETSTSETTHFSYTGLLEKQGEKHV